jgi:hypothetical protein
MTIAAIVSARGVSAQSLLARPGLWKLEATAGSLKVPMTQCVDAKDIADPQRVGKVFGHPFHPMTDHPEPCYHELDEPAQQTCEFRDVKETSDSLTFTYRCKGLFSLTEQGSLKFDSPAHYSGVFTVVAHDEKARHVVPTISTEGSRMRDCTDADRAKRGNLGYVTDSITGKDELVDLTVPDPDVMAAEAASSVFDANLTPCEISTYPVQGVGIDLSGVVAKLDVELPPALKHLDIKHVCIPAWYGGVPVEQSFVETFQAY